MKKLGVVKLAVLGAGAVGKSTLIARLVSGDFIETSMTVGFDVDTWKVAVNATHELQVCMFDFGGSGAIQILPSSPLHWCKDRAGCL